MLGLRLVALPLLALVAVGLAAPAAAQEDLAPCRLCSTKADKDQPDRPAMPLRLEVETRLDFDKVVFDGKGHASLVLSPGGIARASGAATAFGARPMPGAVVIRGEPGRAVRVELPTQVTLSGGGGGALRIESLVTDLPAFPRIGPDGSLSFRFGGDLRLSGDSDGNYHGTIDIIVEYL